MKKQNFITRLAACGFVFFTLVCLPILALAGEGCGGEGRLFMGIKAGNQAIEMRTQFTRRTSGVVTEESSFKNSYTSNSGGLFVGYTLPHKRLYLGSQLFFDAFDNGFTSAAGSSHFIYRLNRAFGIDLLAGLYLTRRLSAFAKLGLARGDFDFSKSSPTSTVYDIQRNLYGYTLGVGLAYDIAPPFTAKIGYEQTNYEETEIDATLGARSDKSLVEPRVESIFLTLQYNFNL